MVGLGLLCAVTAFSMPLLEEERYTLRYVSAANMVRYLSYLEKGSRAQGLARPTANASTLPSKNGGQPAVFRALSDRNISVVGSEAAVRWSLECLKSLDRPLAKLRVELTIDSRDQKQPVVMDVETEELAPIIY